MTSCTLLRTKIGLVLLFVCCSLFTLPATSTTGTAPTDWGPADIQYLHVVCSNHFDAGYTNYLVDVVNEYFDKYIPEIWKLSKEVERAYNQTFTYMLHAWLVSLYMDCLPDSGLHCPSTEERNLFIESVNKQEIVWYSFPFNSQLELYDESMIDYGIYLSQTFLPTLSKLFTSAHTPFVLSQRDVPGLSRSVIPLLKRRNISAFSIGANNRIAPLDVPNIFRWKDSVSDEEIIGLYNSGYGGIEIENAVMVGNFTHALVEFWEEDNAGPPNITHINAAFKQLQQEFPNSFIFFSTFEAFVTQLLKEPAVIESLPVYEEEFADTWAYGVASDPLKIAQFRVAQRLRSNCMANANANANGTANEGGCTLSSIAFSNFSRLLIKNGEHTFGGKAPYFLTNNYSRLFYTPEQVEYALNTEPYASHFTAFRDTFVEQREWALTYAIQALQLSTFAIEQALYADIMYEWDLLKKPIQSLPNIEKEYTLVPIAQQNNVFQASILSESNRSTVFNIQFDVQKTGALIMLQNSNTRVNYINYTQTETESEAIGLGLFLYQSYTEGNMSDFYMQYTLNPACNCSCFPVYCKNNLSNAANYTDQQYTVPAASVTNQLYRHQNDANVFLLSLNMNPFFYTQFGAPQNIYIVYNFSSIFYDIDHNANTNTNTNMNHQKYNRNADANETNGFGFGIELFWLNKTYTRIPEALWLRFNPNLNFDEILVNKIGEFVDIQNVINNGSFHLHAVSPNGSVRMLLQNNNSNSKNLAIDVFPMDSALAAFVPENADIITDFVTPLNIKSDLSKGTAFALFNNLWGTNYPQWYPYEIDDDNSDENAKYRFNVFLH